MLHPCEGSAPPPNLQVPRLHLQAAPQLLLDLGCGSGISGAVLTQHGHAWVGCDISADMLALAQGSPAAPSMLVDRQPLSQPQQQTQGQIPSASAQSNFALASRTGHNCLNHRLTKPQGSSSTAPARGLVLQHDMAQGIPLRGSSMDGAISISAVQWLCHGPQPQTALHRLFSSLYRCLKAERKAVLQVYLTGTAFTWHHAF